MNISKESWLYKIAYWYWEDKSKMPEKTNLCEFFWRLLFSGLALAVSHVLASILHLILIILFFHKITKIGFFSPFGEGGNNAVPLFPRLQGLCDNEALKMFISPAGLVLVFLILAILVAVASLIGLVLWFFVSLGGQAIIHTEQTVYGLGIWILFGIMFGFVMLVIIPKMRRKIQKSELWMLTKAYLKAKKDRVCPLIEFVGGNDENEVTEKPE